MIAEAKLWAVEKSHRTILLISPQYLEEEWPRFQYWIAQHEMLKLRHLIIPVILRTVEDTNKVDPLLKNIMDSLTCIVWPQDGNQKKVGKFWKRLELALPKRKVAQSHTESTVQEGVEAMAGESTLEVFVL